MRVLLLNPPFPLFKGESKLASPPLGLAYMAAVLEKTRHEIRILDAAVEGFGTEVPMGHDIIRYGLPYTEIVRRVREYSPDLVGISCVFSTLHHIVLELCAEIKRALPGTRIVLGGTHATVMAEEMVRDANVDFVIRGEGEYALAELADRLAAGESLRDVRGLTWEEDGKTCATPQVFIEDMDGIPFPARHLLNMDAYHRVGRLQDRLRHGRRSTTVITSRGCPASCTFCSIHAVWGKRFRAHSADYVLRELKMLRDRFGISHVVFEDDNITLDRERVGRIFRGMIEQRLQLTWSAPNGVAVWCLDEGTLGLMRDSGCRLLYLAIESGNQDTLKRIIRKPLTPAKVAEVLRACRRLGIRVHAFFVIGLPGETMEAMRQSMDYAARLDVGQISIAIATPYPGTPMYDICAENGYLPDDYDYGRLMTRYGMIRTPDFTPQDVEALASATLIRFSLRHPVSTARRLVERIMADPRETGAFILKRLASLRRKKVPESDDA
ncbi:MAG: B12-binding domain-containing radical SAM protein [Planctomycetota bacterium]|jgi:magnesium-protoporphyrin IX monomethyl ester (oxidative) cyclase